MTTKTNNVKTATKPAPKKPVNKPATNKPATPKVAKPAYYRLGDGYPYPGGSSHILRRCMTFAALIEAGIMSVSKNGFCRKLAHPDVSKYTDITRSKTNRVWKPKMLLDGSFLPKAQNSMEGKNADGYHVDYDTIQKFRKLIQKGGKSIIEVKGIKEEYLFVPDMKFEQAKK